jgi:hypothetical protein
MKANNEMNKLKKISDSGNSSLIESKDNVKIPIKSNNIYAASNSRNNVKLLESTEGVLRARSYNKYSNKAKQRYLNGKLQRNNTIVIQDDFTDIDRFLLGSRNNKRGK